MSGDTTVLVDAEQIVVVSESVPVPGALDAAIALQQVTVQATLAGEAAVATAEDRVATGEDRTQTGADRVATGADRVATGQDRTQTGADQLATAADRVATSQDRTQTGLDRVATGADRVAASASASQALAVFGTAADLNAAQQIMLGYANTAGNQAQLAAGFAASASSVVQQDLSGVTAQALHRSPNAITALFLYDTSKDSDGGAWVDRCAHTSWQNEALNGTWLYGPTSGFASEIEARDWLGALGQASVLTGDNSTFTNGVGAWATAVGSVTATSVSGRLRLTNTGALGTNGSIATPVTTVIGQRYRVDLSYLAITAGANVNLRIGTTAGGSEVGALTIASATVGSSKTFSFVATATTTYIGFSSSTAWPQNSYAEFDDITVRPVSYATNPSGAYYQSSADGKFYRLWKNLYRDSTNLSTANWVASNVAVTANAATAPDGTNTATLMVLNNGSAGGNIVCAGAIVTLVAGVTYTQTTEVKPSGTKTAFTLLSGAALYLDGLARSFVYTLSGAGSVALAAGGSASGASTTITALANGWYRCTLTFTPTVSGNVAMQHRDGVTGDGVNGFYLGHTQVELGSVWTGNEIKGADGPQTETFRGNVAKFPRLSAIVAEAANVTIYDLTQPGRPMWMRAIPVGAAAPYAQWWRAARNATSLFALNGVVCMGVNNGGPDGANGLLLANFPADALSRYSVTDVAPTAPGVYTGGIAQRQSNTLSIVRSLPFIVAGPTNAVAMTVLPDAPLDPVTGLSVPTIAVHSNGGVSVIKQDGTVASHAFTAGSSDSLCFSGGWLAYSQTAGNFGFGVIRVSSITGTTFAATFYAVSTPVNGIAANVPAVSKDRVFGTFWRNTNVRMSFVRCGETSYDANMLRADIAPTYNTGWMTGDIRRCWLSDTAAGTAQALELVTNGTFNTDATGWTAANGGTLSVTSGEITVTNGSAAVGRAVQGIATVIGRTYVYTATARNGTSTSAGIGWSAVFGSIAGGSVTTAATTNTPLSLVFTATDTTTYIALSTGTVTVGQTAIFDNVSVQEVVSDRSYKAKPLTITGTLARTAVATAAQAMFYSGWSATNYLQEPYSADLDFGTGAWRVGAWVNVPVSLAAGGFPLGAEVVTNGAFAANITGWTTYNGGAGTGAATWDASGAMLCTPSASGLGGGYQDLTLVPGRCYSITATSSGASVNLIVYPGTSFSGGTLVTHDGSNNHSLTFVAGATTQRIMGYVNTNGTPGTIDNISVKEVGMACIFDRSAATGAYIRSGVDALGHLTVEAYDGTTTRRATSAAAYNTATTSVKASFEYATSGTLSVSVNGAQVGSTTGAPLLTLNNAAAVTTIGNSRTLDAAFPGSIALVKPTATLPTAEQKAFMYAQESFLFQPSAQCTLPDSGAVVDLVYDDMQDRWKVVSAANESSWTGLVRTSSAAVSAGSFTKAAHRSGVKLLARSTTNPGVDVTIPAYGLREELVNRAERAARLARLTQCFDFVGGFTGNTTNGSTAIASVAGLSVPSTANLRGTTVSGTGIPASTVITDVIGTTIYISNAATATNAGVQIAFGSFPLPVGYEAVDIFSAGLMKIEGSTKDFTRAFDGFVEREVFAAAPGYTAQVHINARRTA